MKPLPELIYRVISADDWEQTKASDVVPLGESDKRDGFVHLSTQATLLETANLYFKPSQEPVVLEVEVAQLGNALKWEAAESRGGVLFPHLYTAGITMASIRAVVVLDASEQGFSLGERIEFR